MEKGIDKRLTVAEFKEIYKAEKEKNGELSARIKYDFVINLTRSYRKQYGKNWVSKFEYDYQIGEYGKGLIVVLAKADEQVDLGRTAKSKSGEIVKTFKVRAARTRKDAYVASQIAKDYVSGQQVRNKPVDQVNFSV